MVRGGHPGYFNIKWSISGLESFYDHKPSQGVASRDKGLKLASRLLAASQGHTVGDH